MIPILSDDHKTVLLALHYAGEPCVRFTILKYTPLSEKQVKLLLIELRQLGLIMSKSKRIRVNRFQTTSRSVYSLTDRGKVVVGGLVSVINGSYAHQSNL